MYFVPIRYVCIEFSLRGLSWPQRSSRPRRRPLHTARKLIIIVIIIIHSSYTRTRVCVCVCVYQGDPTVSIYSSACYDYPSGPKLPSGQVFLGRRRPQTRGMFMGTAVARRHTASAVESEGFFPSSFYYRARIIHVFSRSK